MTDDDQLTLLLRDLDRPAQPRPEFAEQLLARALAPSRAGSQPPPPTQRRPSQRVRAGLLAAALLVLLATVASAAYLVTRAPAPPIPPKRAQLTLPWASEGGNGPSSIAAVGPDGRLRTLWRCARHGFCGDISSLAWSPDGRHVAFLLTEIGGRSAYIGLHVIDLASGKDTHIPYVPNVDPTKVQPDDVLVRLVRETQRRLGCLVPSDLAWSPDSRSLAYACAVDPGSIAPGVSRIFVIRPDGSGRRLVPTGVRAAVSPSWSPDGTRIAFATARIARGRFRTDTKDPYTTVHSSVYAVGLDGSHRHLLATDATAPSWSPDGTAIAYWSACGGIALVSPGGTDITPGAEPGACAVIGHRGEPAWSPDGTQIAISWQDRLYVVHTDGSGLKRLPVPSGQQSFPTGRPAWAPGNGATRGLQQHADPQGCGSCL